MIARRSDTARLDDMLRAVAALRRVTLASPTELANDEDTLMLVVHYLEILGEAANGVSYRTQRLNPRIPWAAMTFARNRLSHRYFDIDPEAVFEMASRDAPALIEPLEALIAVTRSQERPID